MQSEYAAQKKKYKIFTRLRDQSGFGWDELTKCVTAPFEVWEAYIREHSGAAQFRNATLPNFEDLDTLFSGRVATGQFAGNGNITPATNDVEANEEGDEGPTNILGNDAQVVLDFTVGATPTNVASGNSRPPKRQRVESLKKGRNHAVIAQLQAITHQLEKPSSFTVACKMFDDKFTANYTVLQKMRLKVELQKGKNAEMFVVCSDEERVAWIEVCIE